MLTKLTYVQQWVLDQDEALDFYTNALGMDLHEDVTIPEMGNFRWLTVRPSGQSEVAIVLMAIPGPPVFDEETAKTIRGLIAKGFATGLFFSTDDCRATIEQLRSKGVEIAQEPMDRPYGVDAGVRDPSGNQLRLVQAP